MKKIFKVYLAAIWSMIFVFGINYCLELMTDASDISNVMAIILFITLMIITTVLYNKIYKPKPKNNNEKSI